MARRQLLWFCFYISVRTYPINSPWHTSAHRIYNIDSRIPSHYLKYNRVCTHPNLWFHLTDSYHPAVLTGNIRPSLTIRQTCFYSSRSWQLCLYPPDTGLPRKNNSLGLYADWPIGHSTQNPNNRASLCHTALFAPRIIFRNYYLLLQQQPLTYNRRNDIPLSTTHHHRRHSLLPYNPYAPHSRNSSQTVDNTFLRLPSSVYWPAHNKCHPISSDGNRSSSAVKFHQPTGLCPNLPSGQRNNTFSFRLFG